MVEPDPTYSKLFECPVMEILNKRFGGTLYKIEFEIQKMIPVYLGPGWVIETEKKSDTKYILKVKNYGNGKRYMFNLTINNAGLQLTEIIHRSNYNIATDRVMEKIESVIDAVAAQIGFSIRNSSYNANNTHKPHNNTVATVHHRQRSHSARKMNGGRRTRNSSRKHAKKTYKRR